jgi:hypothetical protein
VLSDFINYFLKVFIEKLTKFIQVDHEYGIQLGLYLLILNETLNMPNLTYEIMSKLKINSTKAEYSLRHLIRRKLGAKRLDLCNTLVCIFEKYSNKRESIHLFYVIVRILFNRLNNFHQLVLNNDYLLFISQMRSHLNKLNEDNALLNEITLEQSTILNYIYSNELLENETNLLLDSTTKMDLILYINICLLDKCDNPVELSKSILKFNEYFNLTINSSFAKRFCYIYLTNFKDLIELFGYLNLNKKTLNKYCANSFELCIRTLYCNQLNNNSLILFNNMKIWLYSLNIMPFMCRKQTFNLWRQLLIICKTTNNKELVTQIKQFFSKYLLNEFGLQFDIVRFFLEKK